MQTFLDQFAEKKEKREIKKYFTVKEITKRIKDLIEGDSSLNDIWVKGEISNFKKVSSGHFYFTLKDEFAQLSCVMFRPNLKFLPEDGMSVIVGGSVGVYERKGNYQFYVREIKPDGLGELYLAFEQLKKKLEKEGLFDPSRKKPLPKLPQRIGIVTSPTGAVIRDILNIIKRRFFNVHIILAPVPVQGDDAPYMIARAIGLMNRIDVDVIIVGRGGGSIEELWAFNEEIVARAIFESKTPVISAVGHETDFTIADFVADRRAATPSEAAELVVPEKDALRRELASLMTRLEGRVRKMAEMYAEKLRAIERSVAFRKPKEILHQHRQHLDDLLRKAESEMNHFLEIQRKNLDLQKGKLDTLSPLGMLERGYAICLRIPERKVVKGVDEVERDDRVCVLVRDGEIACSVEEKRKISR
ncbi:MAG: exodeoxyribonuclease VII large subunit [Candidatus Syntropharchaeia archaeon]